MASPTPGVPLFPLLEESSPATHLLRLGILLPACRLRNSGVLASLRRLTKKPTFLPGSGTPTPTEDVTSAISDPTSIGISVPSEDLFAVLLTLARTAPDRPLHSNLLLAGQARATTVGRPITGKPSAN